MFDWLQRERLQIPFTTSRPYHTAVVDGKVWIVEKLQLY